MNKIVAAVGMATLSLGVLAEDNVAKYMWDGNAGNLNLADSGNWYLDGTQDGEKQRGLPNLSEDSDFKYRTDRAVLKDLSRFETRKLELAQWGGIAQIDVTNATMKVVNKLMIGCGGGSAAVNIYDDATVDAGFVEVGFWNSHQDCSLNVYGGNLIASSNDWAGSIRIGMQSENENYSVKGEMNVYGGTVFATNSIKIGYGYTLNPCRETASVLNIEGGRTTGVSMELGGFQPTASGYVSVSCGELALSGDVNIACQDNAWCEVDVSGGLLSVGGTLRVGNDAEALHAAMTVSGGVVDVGTLSIARHCDGTVNLTGGSVSATKIEQDSSAPESAVSRIYADGGKIVAKSDNVSFMTRLDEVCLGAGGLVIDDGGYTVKATDTCTFTGIGGITKEGTGTLKLDAAYNAHGVINVLSGTLRLPANATVYCEGVNVAENATLNTNNATVVTVTKKIVSSVWTNASGDGNAANAANWQSHIKYFLEDGTEKEDLAKVLDGVLPTADTDVAIPASSATHPDMSALAAKSVTFVVSNDIALRGDCSVPEIVKTAVAWYDPDDSSTVEVNESGRVVAVKNKGTAGNVLDLVPYDENSLPSYGAANMIATRRVFGHYNEEKGLGSNGFYDFGTSGLTLFSVLERHEEGEGQVFGIEVQSGYDWDDRGLAGIAQWPSWSRGRLMVDCITNNAPGLLVIENLQNDALKPYIWCIAAGPTSASGFGVYKDANGDLATVSGTDLEYDSLGASDHEDGKRKVFLGMRRENPAGSSGYVGESMIFNRKLTDEEQAAVRDYLYTKWYTAADMSNIPANLTLENDARIDFGGGSWAFDKITGAGTIGNANVTVEDSVEPGLVVEGTVDFGDNAGFDFSSIHEKPNPGVIVLLTCTGFTGEAAIKNWNFPSQSIRLRTVDNNNGTVSVVADIRNRAMVIFVR